MMVCDSIRIRYKGGEIMKRTKKRTAEMKQKMSVLILFFAGVLALLGFAVWVTAVVVNGVNDNNAREFTISGRFDISEIRINVDTSGNGEINASDNLLTLGFNPNSRIDRNSRAMIRYTDAETREVVEISNQNIEDYVEASIIPELVARVEEYRLKHTGQSLDFDNYGNIKVRDAGGVLYSGGYLWGGHTLSVVILDAEASAPRFDSRDFLFFSNDEEIMQGTSCGRIIVREKISGRRQGSIELVFGTRCPLSAQPR